MQLKNVVLPAPLGPMMLTMLPLGMAKLSWLTATRPPKRLVTSVASRIFVIVTPLHQRLNGFGLNTFMLSDFPLGMKFAPAHGRRPQPFGPDEHHDNEQN